MGVVAFLCAIVACGLMIWLTNLWDARKERQRSEAAVRETAVPNTVGEVSHKTVNGISNGTVSGTSSETNHVASAETESETEPLKGARDLLLETLTKIGCQYELAEEEDDDRIFFGYQGEHFFANAKNDWHYIQIWDIHWWHVELYDVDEFSRLRKVINGSNLKNSVTTVFTVDEVGKNVDVHSKSIILFVPQIPDLGRYLQIELNEFFRAHQYVSIEMAKLREKEESMRSS